MTVTTQRIKHETLSEPTKPMTAAERTAKVQEWYKLQEQLATIRKQELELRRELDGDAGMFDPSKNKGTQNFAFDSEGWEGWKLKTERKIDWTVEQCPQLDDAVEAIANSAGQMAGEELLTYKPTLKLSIYNKLTPEEKALIDPFLKSSPGTPTLKLVPPKA